MGNTRSNRCVESECEDDKLLARPSAALFGTCNLSDIGKAVAVMKKKTRWKRVYNPIIGIRFFEGGEYGLGFFTIEKLWRCKEYCGNAIAPDGTRWFEMFMMKVRTDTGLVYKMPFIPWMKASDGEGKMLSDYYDTNPCMSKKRL